MAEIATRSQPLGLAPGSEAEQADAALRPGGDSSDSPEIVVSEGDPAAGELSAVDVEARHVTVAESVAAWRTAIAAGGPACTLVGGAPAEGLDLTHAHPSGLARLLAGRPTRLSSLIREPAAYGKARRQARAIRATAERKAADGVRTCYLALGRARWNGRPRVDGTGAPYEPYPTTIAPVLLRSCRLVPRGVGQDDYDLDLGEVAIVNPEMIRRLAAESGVTADGAVIGALAFGQDGFDPRPVYEAVEDLYREVPGFGLERSLVVGTFTAGVEALLADLDASRQAIDRHPLLHSVAAAHGVPVPEPSTAPAVLSRPDADPSLEPVVVDLDAAQQRVLDLALARGDLALEGPPGSGVTYTLTAIAAGLAAQGRRVLVLASNRTAAEGFVNRLDAVGLGGLALDLHDPGGDHAGVMSGLAAALEAAAGGTGRARSATPDGVSQQLHASLRAARSTLEEATRALHAVHRPWAVSAYQAMEALAELMNRPRPPRTRARFSPEALAKLDRARRTRLVQLLRDGEGVGAYVVTRRDTRWLDARVTTQDDVLRALEAARTARDGLAGARERMAKLATDAGLVPATTASAWLPQLELLMAVRGTLDKLLPAVFEQSLGDLVAATAPTEDAGRLLPEGRDRLRWTERRRLRNRAKALVRPGVHVADVHPLLRQALAQRERWAALSVGGGWPQVPAGLADAGSAADRVLAALALLRRVLGPDAPDLGAMPLHDLETRLADLAKDEAGLAAQPRRTELLADLRAEGLGPLVDDLRRQGLGAGGAHAGTDVGAEYDLAWWTSVLEAIVRDDPRLARHDGELLRRAAETLRQGDTVHVGDGVRRVRAAVANRAATAVGSYPDQAEWLRETMARSHRAGWPTELLRRAGELVGALRPVWVMSPETVAQLLPAAAERPVVDVVIVDDACHLPLPDVAAALSRAEQLVVGGDRRRAPHPGPELSVFDAVAGAIGTVHRLDRDHRTRDGRLLAPLLPGYPEGWVVTTGSRPVPGLRLVPVSGGSALPAPGEDVSISTDAEVRRVVDVVEVHAKHRPRRSLAVVTLGDRHAERIEEALRLEASERPELAAWLARHWTHRVPQPFVVRPAQLALGLERDDVVVSVGLGRTPHGRVVHRFGSLDGPGGLSMLRTALSRARHSTTLVCCFGPDDIDPDRLRTDGARLLYAALRRAADNGSLRSSVLAEAEARQRAEAAPGVTGAGAPEPTAAVADVDGRTGVLPAANDPEPAVAFGDERSAEVSPVGVPAAGGTGGSGTPADGPAAPGAVIAEAAENRAPAVDGTEPRDAAVDGAVDGAGPAGAASAEPGSGGLGSGDQERADQERGELERGGLERGELESGELGSGDADSDDSDELDAGDPRSEAHPARPVDPLVADLRDRLLAAGLPAVVGVGGDSTWPLDLAVADPAVPARMVLGVDLDGPAYAARASLRERDRHRRERLDAAGWTYCRVAAMDLFLDPEAEVARIRSAWEAAIGR